MYQRGVPTSTGNTNRSRLGAHAREDPLGAAREILSAHRRHGGNAERVAASLGVTVHTLRLITRALSKPCPRGLPLFQRERTLLFDTAAGMPPKGYRTLLESVERVRAEAKDPERMKAPAPSAKRVRKAIEAFVARGTATLATLASSVELDGERTLDPGLLSRFRRGKKSLGPALRRRILAAAEASAPSAQERTT
jgi:hypothetical protein